MRIEKIKWRNFLSWGNKWHELDFSDTNSLTLITGNNGVGKSAISNLIIYMLYGKIDGFKQKEIANRYNRAFEGYLWITNKSQEIVIHRGLNPSLLDVSVNGTKIDMSGKSNVDEFLANEIYGISYNLFKNSIVLSVNTFKSFINLGAAEKREIIDRVFGHVILNLASNIASSELKSTKEQESDYTSQLNAYNDTKKKTEQKIEEINKALSQKAQNDTSNLDEQITYFNEQLKINEEKLGRATQLIEEKKQAKQSNTTEIAKYNEQVKFLYKQLKVFSQGICPLCNSKLDDTSHQHQYEELQNTYNEINQKIKTLGDADTSLNETIADLQDKYAKLQRNISTCNTKLNELNGKKNSLDQEYTIKIDTYNETLQSTENDIKRTEKILTQIGEEKEIASIVNDIFSKNGLKKYINEYYIPMVNETLEDMRQRLNIDHRIRFDNNYDCKLFFMGEEVSYSTLSSGERKKCDIAASLAFLKIIKTKINDVNLLFLDEVLSSIDVEYCNELLCLFKEFATELHLNMFIIHHANLENANVDRVIEIVKRNNFSQFLEESL